MSEDSKVRDRDPSYIRRARTYDDPMRNSRGLCMSNIESTGNVGTHLERSPYYEDMRSALL